MAKLDKVITDIMKCNTNLIADMDANTCNVLWDDSCIGQRCCQALKWEEG